MGSPCVAMAECDPHPDAYVHREGALKGTPAQAGESAGGLYLLNHLWNINKYY